MVSHRYLNLSKINNSKKVENQPPLMWKYSEYLNPCEWGWENDLSSDLSWSNHIDQIASKSNKMLGLLRRNLYYCNRQTKSIAYKSLIRPKLEYCSAIWDPHYKSEQIKLDRIQHRGARFAVRDYSRDSSITKMIAELDWEDFVNPTSGRFYQGYLHRFSKIDSYSSSCWYSDFMLNIIIVCLTLYLLMKSPGTKYDPKRDPMAFA